MAWQNGGPGQGGNMADQNGVQAYTLQGVMRFLQTEWHTHERTRNAWEIEREEMKKRIGCLEGEARSSKALRGSMERHVRILEAALRKERENVKKLTNGEHVDLTNDTKELARDEIQKVKEAGSKAVIPKTISHLESEIDGRHQVAQGIRQDKERDKSKTFLTQCATEITYHILPGLKDSAANLELDGLERAPGDAPPTQQELHEVYAQFQAQKRQQQAQSTQSHLQPNHQNFQRNNTSQTRDGPIITEQPAPAYEARSDTQSQNSLTPVQETDRRLQENNLIDANRKLQFPDQQQHNQSEEQVESVSHTYDTYGRQIQPKDQNPPPNSLPVTKTEQDAGDGWDFDEPAPPMPALMDAAPRPDTEVFPSSLQSKSPPRPPGSHRRKSSGARRKSADSADITTSTNSMRMDSSQFKVRFAMRGHLDVVRSVIFTGGGSPADPEFCTAGDDGTVKRWHIPASYGTNSLGEDLDRTAHFTHRGHIGSVCCLAACPSLTTFANGGRVAGDGWIFSGGEDSSVKVWERGRVDCKASLEGHTDAVWALCVLPGTTGSILGDRCNSFGGPDRVLLAAGAANGTILVWAVSAPPQSQNVAGGSNRGARSNRRANSISAGSNFPNSPQPSIASNTPFNYSLVHKIERPQHGSPTAISPLSPAGTSFVVGYSDASVLVFDSRTGDELVGMASQETYDGTPNTAINAIVASSTNFDTRDSIPTARRSSLGDDEIVHGVTGGDAGVEGLVIAGYEDRFIRLFDANSGQCTYTMLAHPSAISSLSLSSDGRELVSGGHDASLRFWSLEKRNCTQEITNHRVMRGEGVCAVAWSSDGRFVISAGGDGAVKVFSRI